MSFSGPTTSEFWLWYEALSILPQIAKKLKRFQIYTIQTDFFCEKGKKPYNIYYIHINTLLL